MDELIRKQDALDAIHCNITATGRQNAELVAATIGAFADRIKALPTVQTEITHEQAIDYLNKTGWMQTHDRILTESKIVPSAQPDVPDINVGELISRQDAIDAVNRELDRETLLNRLVRKVAIDAIRIVPPVQPTQGIIYCMDCKYFCKKSGFCTLGTGRFVYEEDFCSQAEKRGDSDADND